MPRRISPRSRLAAVGVLVALGAGAGATAPTAAAWAPLPSPLAQGGTIASPSVVEDARGGFVVGWIVPSAGADVARVRHVDANGAGGPIATLSQPADGDAADLSLDATPDGVVVAAWTQGPDGARVVRSRVLAPGAPAGPVQLLSTAAGAWVPHVDVNASGQAVVAWMRSVAGVFRIEARRLALDAAPGPLQTLTVGAPHAFSPRAAVAPGGEALVTWERENPEPQLQASRLPADGGPAGPVFPVAGGDAAIGEQRLAALPDGRFLAVYVLSTGAPSGEHAVQRRVVDDGGPGAPADLATPGHSVGEPALAVGADGSAMVAWLRAPAAGEKRRVQARGLDAGMAVGPVLPDLSAPGTGADEPTVAVDADGDALIAWAHEAPSVVDARRVGVDGALEPAGGAARLAGPDAANPREALRPRAAVTAGGDGLVAVVRSGGGQPLEQLHGFRSLAPVRDEAGGGGGPGGGAQGGGQDGTGAPGGSPARDLTRPVISRLSLSARRFAVGRGRTARVAARRSGTSAVPRGTHVRFALSEPATVRLDVRRRLPGRRAGRRCVAPRRTRPTARRCTRSVTVMTLVRAVERAGAVRVRWTGRVGRRALSPGPHRLAVTATDAAGNRSARRERAFRVVAPEAAARRAGGR